MKLIEPCYKIYEQEPGLGGIYKAIERVGRVCYKSEDKITEDSALPFVKRMIDSQHYAMLEHGTVYLEIPDKEAYDTLGNNWVRDTYWIDPFSFVAYGRDHYYITTNYRVLVENGWLDDLKYLCEPTEFHEKRVTVHFVADAGVMREFFRHRVFSMAQESTRYCNYSKNKFGSELTFILPPWVNKNPKDIDHTPYADVLFREHLLKVEEAYLKLLQEGWSPQQARSVLPLCIKAEGVMTGFVEDWKHFFELRALGTTGAPHPQAKELAMPLMREFKDRCLID